MNSIQEIAQWVIDNRYSKSEKEKISDLEMYNTIVDLFYNLSKATQKEPCEKCQWIELKDKTSVCKVCGTQCPF
jgi:uncharacterized paraquat-inducible protein A